jgi:hypothetical protein
MPIYRPCTCLPGTTRPTFLLCAISRSLSFTHGIALGIINIITFIRGTTPKQQCWRNRWGCGWRSIGHFDRTRHIFLLPQEKAEAAPEKPRGSNTNDGNSSEGWLFWPGSWAITYDNLDIHQRVSC